MLPEGCQLHHTFHVSQLKKHIGPHVILTKHLPLVDENGLIKMEPEAVLERKLIQYSCGALADQVGEYASGGSYLGGFSFYPESIPSFQA